MCVEGERLLKQLKGNVGLPELLFLEVGEAEGEVEQGSYLRRLAKADHITQRAEALGELRPHLLRLKQAREGAHRALVCGRKRERLLKGRDGLLRRGKLTLINGRDLCKERLFSAWILLKVSASAEHLKQLMPALISAIEAIKLSQRLTVIGAVGDHTLVGAQRKLALVELKLIDRRELTEAGDGEVGVGGLLESMVEGVGVASPITCLLAEGPQLCRGLLVFGHLLEQACVGASGRAQVTYLALVGVGDGGEQRAPLLLAGDVLQ